ncbi:HEAT repeat domain-containing protein [Kitasatospora sp. NPDC004669]|uniref:HEAT repeat domain-containing protein n=1 Tax=Kitasatospora sp. NPDC004669 TaxID=3154555 RepID=UPI0033B090E6
MWEGLDEIDWAGHRHNYGSATDVPGLLRRCAGPDPREAGAAAGALDNALFHQGGWICSAASAALPYLLRLAARTDVPTRVDLLELMTELSTAAQHVAANRVDPGWEPAWERALPDALSLLSDPEPGIRRSAVHLVGVSGGPGELILPALLTQWGVEHDAAARLDLAIAIGAATRRPPTGGRVAEALALLHGLLDDPEPQLRLAAVHALAPADPELAPRHLGLVLDAVRDPGVEVWRETSEAGCGVVAIQDWTADLFPDDLFPDTLVSYVLGLLADHPDPQQRAGALSLVGGLLSRRRSPAPDLLPGIAARLDDPDTEVRYRAAELLACLGPSAVAHADAVAELIDDSAALTTRTGESVADAAIWALARMGDPRCVPALTDRLTGTRLGFHTSSRHHSRLGNGHWPHLPALHELLIPLRGHAAALVPAIRTRLPGADHGLLVRSLCEVLAAWGPVASTALPELLDLLDGESTWTHAATALAGIGPAGGAARESLLAHATAGGRDADLAAWSYWRLGGDPDAALAVLGPAATEGRFPGPALRRLAELGPHATPYAHRLREMAASDDAWVSVEAAYALWSATGDTGTAVPALLTVCRPLTQGSYLPAMLAAVRHLTHIGPAAHPAATLLAQALTLDDRLSTSADWRAFVDDEAIRAAVTELVTAATPPADPRAAP